MNKLISFSLASFAAVTLAVAPVRANEDEHEIERQDWSFGGFSGQFDKAQLQRGFQVYREVCSACHGLKRLSFRNLSEPGGPEFPAEAVKKLAAEWPNQILEINEAGELAEVVKDPKDGKTVTGFKYVKRPALPSDPILGPYKNDREARAAQNGALPPDLSIMAKARGVHRDPSWIIQPFLMLNDIKHAYQEGGADYVHATLTGYDPIVPAYKSDEKGKLVSYQPSKSEDEKSFERCASIRRGEGEAKDVCNKLQEGMNYNTVFPGHQIAMPSPLVDGAVTYQDGSKPTLDNYARDVAAFLAWSADPSLNQRKRIGWVVMLYMLITTVLLYFAKKRIWSNRH